jgi:Phage derived protein Gp49-like (DUF891)
MRLVRMGRAVWDVLAIADEGGGSVWQALRHRGESAGVERLLVTLEHEVPLNGPPTMNTTRCRALGDGIYEFKETGVRVLWFYDEGEPVRRRCIICTHYSPKVKKKEFQREIKKAHQMREAYLLAKATGRLRWPKDERK